MTKIDDIDANYWVVFAQLDGTVLHMVAYEAPPLVQDVLHIVEELRTDEEFGIGDIVDQTVMTLIKDGEASKRCLDSIQQGK